MKFLRKKIFKVLMNKECEKMGYCMDLSKISVEAYKEILKNKYLLPSRKILHFHTSSSSCPTHFERSKILRVYSNK
jgi:hypothetical protein